MATRTNRRSFDCASRDETARGFAQDDNFAQDDTFATRDFLIGDFPMPHKYPIFLGWLEAAVDEGGGTASGEELDEEDGGGQAGALEDEWGAAEDFDGAIEPFGRDGVEGDAEEHHGDHGDGDVCDREGKGAEAAEDGHGGGDVRGAEEYPGEADEVEGDEDA